MTAARMHRLGIETCSDIRKLDNEALTKHFGSFGERLKQLSFGIDDRPVQVERVRKSVSVENTYPDDLQTLNSCLSELPRLEQQLARRISRLEDRYAIQKQFIKIKFHDFVQTTVETLSTDTDSENYARLCQEGYARGNKPVRLLGLGVRLVPIEAVSNSKETEQLVFSLE